MSAVSQALIERHTFLQRPRLYPWLQPSASGYGLPRVVLFVGVAGSGKTIACRHYLHRLQLATIEVKLGSGTAQSWSARPPAGTDLGHSTGPGPVDLASITTPTILLIDAFEQALTDDGALAPPIAAWLPALLDQPLWHIVLASQVTPSDASFTTLAAKEQLYLVDGAALALTPDEIQTLWRQRHGRDLGAEAAHALWVYSGGLASVVDHACTTGWTPSQPVPPLLQLAGSKIMSNLPRQLYDAVIELSVLDEVTASGMAALGTTGDHLHRWEHLRRRQLLVANDGTARLHPVVRPAALERLKRDRRRFTARSTRALAHAVAEGRHHEAWRLAVEAQLWAEARQVVLNGAQALRQRGAANTVIAWIRSLPASERTHDVDIMLARCQGDVGDLDGAVLTLSALRATAADKQQAREATIWLAVIIQARGDVQSADALVQPYVHDATLPMLEQARIYRIHAIALALSGDGPHALQYIQHAIEAAQAASEPRLVALAYGDQATIAGRMGRLAEAERALRLAERCWRELDSSADLGITLNARAMLMLSMGDPAAALKLSQEARSTSLVAGRLRDAAVASATSGDVLLAIGQYTEAWQHYLVGAEDSAQSGYLALRAYCLAMQSHIARLRHDTDQAALLLPKLQHHLVESAEHHAWLVTGIVAAELTLRMQPGIAALQHALEQVRPAMEDAHIALLATLAQAHWCSGDLAAAFATWRELEQALADRPWHGSRRLARLAAAEPAFLTAIIARESAPVAQSVLAERPRSSLPIPDSPPRPVEHVALRMQLFGPEERVWWRGEPVAVRQRGLALLVLLLTTSRPMSEDELLSAIWGQDQVGVRALHKVVERLRAALPDVVRRRAGRYALALGRTAMDVDLLSFLELDARATPMDQLTAWAHAASSGCLAHQSTPWADRLRQQVNRRLALVWVEVARRAEGDGDGIRAHDAYERALVADPLSDPVARAALLHAQRSGDRSLVIERYLRYRQAIKQELGGDPAADLQLTYLQALEA